MGVIGFLIVLVCVVVLAVWGYIIKQGDAEFEFITAQRTPFKLEELTANAATFSCELPFVNKGSQDGTIMDAYTRHLLPYEQYDAAEVNSRLENLEAPRTDGYWEALIVFKGEGGAIRVTVELTAKQGDIKAALTEMVDMPIDIVYQVVARSDWYITKTRLVMTAQEIQQALAGGLAAAN